MHPGIPNTLRLTSRMESHPRARYASVLHAVPHINYLRNFARIEWHPELLGLDEIGMGYQPTLVAAPQWAMGWLRSVECIRQNFWDMPLISRAPFEVWGRLPHLPRGMRVSESFTQAGGFINCWRDEQYIHLVWGRVRADAAESVLAWVWLQNVLAGGRRWQRRELGYLPETFREVLALGYMSLGRPNEPVHTVSLGLPRPILRKKDGRLLYAGDWIGAPEAEHPPVMQETEAILLPELGRGPEERTVAFDAHRMNEGVWWQLQDSSPPPLMLGLYASGLGERIDRLQDNWERWIETHLPEMDADKRTELTLCLREAVLNADQHGCQGRPGQRLLMAAQKLSDQRILRARVSDPGKGHALEGRRPEGMSAQQPLGRNLGLVLIEGLASRVRYLQQGATLEFDFRY